MEKKEAFKIVYEELSKIPYFMGSYDAKNGNIDFIAGIGTVMEYISYEVSEENYLNFSKEFSENLQKSKEKAKKY